jgi:hypothetical protein
VQGLFTLLLQMIHLVRCLTMSLPPEVECKFTAVLMRISSFFNRKKTCEQTFTADVKCSLNTRSDIARCLSDTIVVYSTLSASNNGTTRRYVEQVILQMNLL